MRKDTIVAGLVGALFGGLASMGVTAGILVNKHEVEVTSITQERDAAMKERDSIRKDLASAEKARAAAEEDGEQAAAAVHLWEYFGREAPGLVCSIVKHGGGTPDLASIALGDQRAVDKWATTIAQDGWGVKTC